MTRQAWPPGIHPRHSGYAVTPQAGHRFPYVVQKSDSREASSVCRASQPGCTVALLALVEGRLRDDQVDRMAPEVDTERSALRGRGDQCATDGAPCHG